MADKKVDRYRPDRVVSPNQQTTSALSETGTINVAEAAHDKGKAALLDKFRQREERWRMEQSLHDREAAGSVSPPTEGDVSEGEDAPSTDDAKQGGAR